MDYLCVFILLWKLYGLWRSVWNCQKRWVLFSSHFFPPPPPLPPHPVCPPKILNPGVSPSVCLTLWSATLRHFTATWPSTFCLLWREPIRPACSTTTPCWTLQAVSLSSPQSSSQNPTSNCWRSFELWPAVRQLFFPIKWNADDVMMWWVLFQQLKSDDVLRW